MPLSREILDRVDRVADFHRATRQAPKTPQGAKPPASPPAPSAQSASTSSPLPEIPPRFNGFENAPKIPLPTNLLDLPEPTLFLMTHGVEALPESQRMLPQDIRLLATWLFMASGLTQRRTFDGRPTQWLSYPSAGGTYPTEIYVAAFAIEGLDPGFYHFNPREFCLRRLRDGWETLSHLIRGRPDLNFLKTVPATLLVSTVFHRASARFGKRGYCTSLFDAGHLIENLVLTATGLGITTLVRQAINDNTMRELIGLPIDPTFAEAESVQAMIAWTDKTSNPLRRPADAGPPMALTTALTTAPPIAMPPLERKLPVEKVLPYGSIQAVHFDCVAPGMPVREVRAPLTELVVLAADYPSQNLPEPPDLRDFGLPLRDVLLNHPPTDQFGSQPIGRDQLWTLSQLAFGKGAYWPLLPDGKYPALVRPFWIVHEITGLDSGVWHYNIKAHTWHLLRTVVPNKVDRLRQATRAMAADLPRFSEAAAVCVLAVHWQQLLTIGGPDLYRLAHIEAGIVGQRIALASAAMGFGYAPSPDFFHDIGRKLLGLEKTNWEPIYTVAIGPIAQNQE